jgi:hypothetical protein
MWMLLTILICIFPMQAQALSLQDLVEQGTFEAGGVTFSNFTASTAILGATNPSCCTFSTLDTIQAELLPEGLKLSQIEGQGSTTDMAVNRLPNDFHVRLSFDTDQSVFHSGSTIEGRGFISTFLNQTSSGPSQLHTDGLIDVQVSFACSHTNPPAFPCDFAFSDGAVGISSTLNNTLIPEPTTAGLMVAGVALIVIRRYITNLS